MRLVITSVFSVWFCVFISTFGQEIPIFTEDFEGHALWTLPTNWSIIWNGRGNTLQVVTNEFFYSGNRSLQLWGRPGWSAVVERKFGSTAQVIGYEYKIFIDERASEGQEHPGFFKHGAEGNVWGTFYAAVIFDHVDGKIKAENGYILGEWHPKIWYTVKVHLNRKNKTYTVWINGSLKGSSLPIAAKQPELIDAIALTSGHAGKRIFYDDVRVFSVEQFSSEGTMVSGEISLTRKNVAFGNIVEVKVSVINASNAKTAYFVKAQLYVPDGFRMCGGGYDKTVTFSIGELRPGGVWKKNVCFVAPNREGPYEFGGVVLFSDNPYGQGTIMGIPLVSSRVFVQRGAYVTFRVPGGYDGCRILLDVFDAIGYQVASTVGEFSTVSNRFETEPIYLLPDQYRIKGVIIDGETGFPIPYVDTVITISKDGEISLPTFKVATTITLNVIPTTIIENKLEVLTFTGHLKRKGTDKGLAGQTVYILIPGEAPVPVVTNSEGAFALKYGVKLRAGNYEVIARYAGGRHNNADYEASEVATKLLVIPSSKNEAPSHNYGETSGWFMVSVPTDQAVAAAFGTTLFRWTGSYWERLAGDAPLSPLEGYWAMLPANKLVISYGVVPQNDRSLFLQKAGWYMISSPWTYKKTDIRVMYNNVTKTWAEAVYAGWIEDKIWGYDTKNRKYYNATIIDPWYGYWIKTNVGELRLIFQYSARLEPSSASLVPSTTVEETACPENFPFPIIGDALDKEIRFSNTPNPVTSAHSTTFVVFGGLADLVEEIKVQVFDLTGKLIWHASSAGSRLYWDTTDLRGEHVANGVYLYQVQVRVSSEWIVSGILKLVIKR